MGEPSQLTDFFREHAKTAKNEFLERFPGAFVLGRFRATPPVIVFLPAQDGVRVSAGAEEDCDIPFELDQTLDPIHVVVAYHPGFRGWTVTEEERTNFGTTIDGERLTPLRPLLLRDRQVVKLGGALSELQFYTSETLWTRMNKAGITRSAPKQKKPAPAPSSEELTSSREEFDSEDLQL
ncbi:MAG: hypothetical protein M9894_06515 [Planctomycetes bacterium]|nr:hypothetical protein [Planctomycetota bacterium]